MAKYALKRTILAIPTVILITILTFTMLELAPGDPLSAILIGSGQDAGSVSQEMRESFRRQHGLDRPAPVRYLEWLTKLAQGDLGNRLIDGRPITEVIGQRAVATFELMVISLTIAIFVGVLLGLISALKQYSRIDYILTVVGFVGVSLPEFFVGISFIAIFSVKLGLTPVSGRVTPGQPFDLTDRLHHLVLPSLVLSLHYIAIFMRYTRASMLDVLNQDYVTVARAKGLRNQTVIMRHTFANALLPIVTIIGLTIPSLIGGAVIVEVIFQWPGMGSLYLEGVNQRDSLVTVSMLLILGTTVVLANLMADLAYAVIDPRIRY